MVVSILSLSTIFLLDFRIVPTPTVWYFLVFIFILDVLKSMFTVALHSNTGKTGKKLDHDVTTCWTVSMRYRVIEGEIIVYAFYN